MMILKKLSYTLFVATLTMAMIAGSHNLHAMESKQAKQRAQVVSQVMPSQLLQVFTMFKDACPDVANHIFSSLVCPTEISKSVRDLVRHFDPWNKHKKREENLRLHPLETSVRDLLPQVLFEGHLRNTYDADEQIIDKIQELYDTYGPCVSVGILKSAFTTIDPTKVKVWVSYDEFACTWPSIKRAKMKGYIVHAPLLHAACCYQNVDVAATIIRAAGQEHASDLLTMWNDALGYPRYIPNQTHDREMSNLLSQAEKRYPPKSECSIQ